MEKSQRRAEIKLKRDEPSVINQAGRDIQGFAGAAHHGTPQPGGTIVRLVAERIVLGPEMSEPAVDVSRGIFGVEVVEIVFGEGLLGTTPYQAGHPGNEDVADGVGIDGVNLGPAPGFVGDTGLEASVTGTLRNGLELDLGERRVEVLCGSRREARLSGRKSGVTWMTEEVSLKTR